MARKITLGSKPKVAVTIMIEQKHYDFLNQVCSMTDMSRGEVVQKMLNNLEKEMFSENVSKPV